MNKLAHTEPSPELLQQLVAAATAARAKAHAPYSRFLVGAALLDEAGRIHTGCNVENAAYPQGLCAEAGAISAMVLGGGKRIQAVMVAAHSGQTDAPVTPCGGCRQKLREFATENTLVYVTDGQTIVGRFSLSGLLPHSFGPQYLDP
jgi:cytidine deaminase